MDYYCGICGITYWPAEKIQKFQMRSTIEFISQHPNQAAYYFMEHVKFYTISEMERICRLKAFL